MPYIREQNLLSVNRVCQAQRALLAGDRFVPFGSLLTNEQFTAEVAGTVLEKVDRLSLPSDPLDGLLYAHHRGHFTIWFYSASEKPEEKPEANDGMWHRIRRRLGAA